MTTSPAKHRVQSKAGMQRYRDRQKKLKAEARGDVVVKPAAVVDKLVPFNKPAAVGSVTTTKFTTNETGCMTPAGRVQVVPDKYGSINCTCIHCTLNKKTGNRYTINHWAYKTAAQLELHEINRLAMPGDIDYQP